MSAHWKPTPRHTSTLGAASSSIQKGFCALFPLYFFIAFFFAPSISISLAFVPLCLLIRVFSAPSVPVGEKTRHISFRHRMVMHRGKAANATVTTIFLKGPETLTNFFFHFVCPLRYPVATGRSFNFTPHSYSLCCCELKERKKADENTTRSCVELEQRPEPCSGLTKPKCHLKNALLGKRNTACM